MLPFLFLLGSLHFYGALSSDSVYMHRDETPDPGPEEDTVYVPGTPGGSWTEEEVASTRLRILQMIYPDWDVKINMINKSIRTLRTQGPVTENVLMRLAFHDCIRYTDGSGGCDGCLNWHGMGEEMPSPFNKKHLYNFPPLHDTDNNGLDKIAERLEMIYTAIDWPFQVPSLEVSLFQSGKSRADLWQLAGLVALERTFERANRACDLDNTARQQVTRLESREACEIKLTKPLKFQTGRSDCVSEDPSTAGYVSDKAETHPKMFGDAKHVIDFGRDEFGMDADHWTALQAIHGVVHNAAIGLKYTWFGAGYLSNMYFKMIANKPTYRNRKGGDLSFGKGVNIWPTAQGDPEGNPVAMTGWRASCMYAWDTIEGGPCVLRPSGDTASDSPNPDKLAYKKCFNRQLSRDKCVPDEDYAKYCKDAWCDENMVEHGAKLEGADDPVVGPWSEGLSDQTNRHSHGFDNQFAFPYEIGLFWNLTVDGVGQRAVGCPGLDEPFGSIDEPLWPFRNSKSAIFASPAMQCEVNTYAPEGKPMHQIVDEFASDNELWAEKFMEGWQQMIANGYAADELEDGPQNGWIGHYSLTKQGVEISDFESFIAENAPVTFTDPTVDPYLCGHWGVENTSCGLRMSTCFNNFYGGGKCDGRGEGEEDILSV